MSTESLEIYDCFLSYREADRSLAELIRNRLQHSGFHVWWDKTYLQSGMRWHDEIEHHCEASRIVIPLLTPDWKLSQWTRYETYGAERIIPILLRGAWDEVVTPPIALWQRDHLNIETASDADWQTLFGRIRHYLDEPLPIPGDRRRPTLLKHRPVHHFVGREATLLEIHEKFFIGQLTALTQSNVIAITALGGVGKTTLARQYAEKFWRCYRQMFWVDSCNGIESGFADIYGLLHPDGERALPIDTRAKRVLRELEQPDAKQSLLIIDDADNEESILPWIPATGDCHVLITSRFTTWSNEISTHPIWVLGPESAKELLVRVSGRTGDKAAEEVAERLQYLPLALEQAAYVKEQPGLGFSDYLRLFEKNEKALLGRKAVGATNYPDSVYLTWRTTVDRLAKGAQAMLRLHAFFAPTPFPTGIYIAGARALAEEADDGSIPDELTVREWKSSLVRYSMARAEPDDCISVHSLVQTVERHELGRRMQEVAARAAMMFWSVLPKPTWTSEIRDLWSKLASHASALANCDLLADVSRGSLYGRLFWFFHHEGNYRAGLRVTRLALEVWERALGPDHPDTLTTAGNLAVMLAENGDFAEAEPVLRRILNAREKLLGPEHSDTLQAMNNLALVLRQMGDIAAAEPLYRRALEINERLLGFEDPMTLTSLNNWAMLLKSTGNYEGAEPLYRRALETRRRVLGPEHPDTLTSINNLAALLEAKGDWADAERLYRLGLAGSERVRGPEHPGTLDFVNNLAFLLESRGDMGSAEPLYLRALEGRIKILGVDHPRTQETAILYQRCLSSRDGHS